MLIVDIPDNYSGTPGIYPEAPDILSLLPYSITSAVHVTAYIHSLTFLHPVQQNLISPSIALTFFHHIHSLLTHQ